MELLRWRNNILAEKVRKEAGQWKKELEHKMLQQEYTKTKVDLVRNGLRDLTLDDKYLGCKRRI